MKGGTGIFIDSNNESTFNHFIQNSTFEYFGSGSNGLIFKATLNNGSLSNYKSLDATTFGNQITTLIIKVCYINDHYTNDKPSLIEPIIYEDFKNEVNIQTDIFLKTMNYLQPLCPAIVYTSVLESNTDLVLKMIHQSISGLGLDDESNKIIKKLVLMQREIQNGKIQKIGIIGMELADGYNTINNEIFTNNVYVDPSTGNKTNVHNMVRYLLIELAIQTGYTHGDYHKGNILVNINKNTYFKGIQGEPILIDFGYALKIPEHTMASIKQLYKNKNYLGILQLICMTPRANGLMLNQTKFNDLFGYICNRPNDATEINMQIDDLIRLKNEAINDRIQSFHYKKYEDKNYPLLPLSNKIKNKMYIGILDVTPLPTATLITLPEIDLNLHFFKHPTAVNLMVSWLHIVCKQVNALNKFIDCCYYYMYIIQLYNPPNKTDWQLFGLIVLYKLHIIVSIDKLIYITSNAYTKEVIVSSITNALPSLNVKIRTFYTLLSIEGTENLNKFINEKPENFITLMSNILTYTDIRQTAQQFGITQSITKEDQENYEFPFQNESIDSEKSIIPDITDVVTTERTALKTRREEYGLDNNNQKIKVTPTKSKQTKTKLWKHRSLPIKLTKRKLTKNKYSSKLRPKTV